MECLVYIANCMYLLSYFMNAMLRLRILTVTAACCLMAYFLLRPEPMMTVVCWNMFFVALNIYQITGLVRRQRAQRATDQQSSRKMAGYKAEWIFDPA